MYKHLSEEKGSFGAIRDALLTAFAMDSFAAYRQFVNVYLADLKRISMLFGGVMKQCLKAAFIDGFPERIWQLLFPSS